jgi:hypothetical protein
MIALGEAADFAKPRLDAMLGSHPGPRRQAHRRAGGAGQGDGEATRMPGNDLSVFDENLRRIAAPPVFQRINDSPTR